MKKTANNLVNKEWARQVAKLFTQNSPDITTLYTGLYTITNEAKGLCKTQSAQDRYDLAVQHVIDALKYGWQFGITDERNPGQKKVKHNSDRRLTVLMRAAIERGFRVGQNQIKSIQKAHASHLRNFAKTPEKRAELTA